MRLAAAALTLAAHHAAAAPDQLICEPATPFYCANVHVGCAGRSKTPTNPFTIVIEGRHAEIAVGGAAVVLADVSTDGDATIIRPASSRDWIKIERSGRFAERIYRRGGALMTYGACRPVPAAG